MPCRDPHPQEFAATARVEEVRCALQERIDDLTRMLCKACSQATGAEDHNGIPILDSELREWYSHHKLGDARRIINEALTEAKRLARVDMEFPCNVDGVSDVTIEDFRFYEKEYEKE